MAERTTPGLKAALTIAGSDSSGGAGLQADLKTWSAMRVYGCSVVTAVTAQNTRGVDRIELMYPDLVAAQIDSVASDIDCQATKTGMLGSVGIVEVVAKAIKRHNLQPLVVDPALEAGSGVEPANDATAAAMMRLLFPLAAVVTPNRNEAARLLGAESCGTVSEGIAAAKELAGKFGCHAVIVTGFSRPGSEADGPMEAVDVFWTGEEIVELTGEHRQTSNVHGAGCTFSAAIAGGLVQGKPLADAVLQAKRLVTESIRRSAGVGVGSGPVNHLAWLDVKK